MLVQSFPRKIERINRATRHVLLHNRLFRRRSRKLLKLLITDLNEGETGGFPLKGPVTRKCFHLMTSSWRQMCVCKQRQFDGGVGKVHSPYREHQVQGSFDDLFLGRKTWPFNNQMINRSFQTQLFQTRGTHHRMGWGLEQPEKLMLLDKYAGHTGYTMTCVACVLVK